MAPGPIFSLGAVFYDPETHGRFATETPNLLLMFEKHCPSWLERRYPACHKFESPTYPRLFIAPFFTVLWEFALCCLLVPCARTNRKKLHQTSSVVDASLELLYNEVPRPAIPSATLISFLFITSNSYWAQSRYCTRDRVEIWTRNPWENLTFVFNFISTLFIT